MLQLRHQPPHCLADPFLGGCPKVDPGFWGSSTSHVHFHSPLGAAQWGDPPPGKRRALHPSEVSPARGGGVGPCHGVALTGAQRLSPRNLPVAADHFRCQTGFVSLGGAPPSLLAGTGAKSGFKKTSLAVGGGRSHPPKPRGRARFALRLPWALLLEHPRSEARLTPWHRAEHPPP